MKIQTKTMFNEPKASLSKEGKWNKWEVGAKLIASLGTGLAQREIFLGCYQGSSAFKTSEEDALSD